jgi:hypothetical protein
MAAVIAGGVALVSAAAYRRLRGTTLAAPAAWAGLSAIFVGIVYASIAWHSDGSTPQGAGLWRYGAAVGTFCPLMAVLGAKRPQDRGWQWVVAALWLVLLVPALQALAARAGDRLELYGVWRMLLAALIAMGVLNYLPTRFGLPALIFAAGQLMLLAPYLFRLENEWVEVGGLGAMLVASVAATLLAGRGNGGRSPVGGKEQAPPTLESFSRRWFEFRDAWGAFWALRVLQRVNQTAELSHWPVRLEWTQGFVPIGELLGDAEKIATDATLTVQMQQTLDGLLRRFERL